MAGAWVQGNSSFAHDDSGGPYASTGVTFGSNCTSGNLIVVAFGFGGSGTPTCADSQSNTYTRKTNTYDASYDQSHAQFFSANITGGANTVTVSQSANYHRMAIGEVRGIQSTPDDGGAGQVQAGGTSTDYYSSGNITTTTTDYVIGTTQNIGEVHPGTGTLTAGATPAYTKREDAGTGIIAIEDASSLASGTFDANWTRNTAHRCISGIMAFKESTGSSPQTLTPSLFTNTNSFYAPTVTRGAVTLTPSLFTNSNSFYVPTVTSTYGLAPALYSNAEAFYSATVTATYALQPSLQTNSESFYSPTITTGAVDLTPSLYTNTQTFYSPTVSQGGAVPQELTPDLFTNTEAFYAPTVSLAAPAESPSGGWADYLLFRKREQQRLDALENQIEDERRGLQQAKETLDRATAQKQVEESRERHRAAVVRALERQVAEQQAEVEALEERLHVLMIYLALEREAMERMAQESRQRRMRRMVAVAMIIDAA